MNYYIEVRTPPDQALYHQAFDWLEEKGLHIGSLTFIRKLFPQSESGAMSDWMNSHPELPGSDRFAENLWLLEPNLVVSCHHVGYRPYTVLSHLWWFPPRSKELAMMFKLKFGG